MISIGNGNARYGHNSNTDVQSTTSLDLLEPSLPSMLLTIGTLRAESTCPRRYDPPTGMRTVARGREIFSGDTGMPNTSAVTLIQMTAWDILDGCEADTLRDPTFEFIMKDLLEREAKMVHAGVTFKSWSTARMHDGTHAPAPAPIGIDTTSSVFRACLTTKSKTPGG